MRTVGAHRLAGRWFVAARGRRLAESRELSDSKNARADLPAVTHATDGLAQQLMLQTLAARGEWKDIERELRSLTSG